MKVMVAAIAVLLALLQCAAMSPVEAQQTPKALRIGVLAGGGTLFRAGLESFRQRLREVGYVEDQTISLIVRSAEGRNERYRELVAELIEQKVDVIVVHGNAAMVSLRDAKTTLPIVMANVGDPLASGFIASLARPGGNITGLTNMAEGVSRKWVELLREVSPKAASIGVLWDSRNAPHVSMWKEIQAAGETLRMTPLAWEARSAEDIERAFLAMAAEKVGGVIILPHPIAGQNRALIVGLAAKHRLPALYPFREFVEAGSLMSYGPSNADMYRRAADYVARILKGAKPAELPVEQPTKFELIINRKAANSLGLMIPQSLLVRADEIIE